MYGEPRVSARDLILKMVNQNPGLTAWQISKRIGRNSAGVSGLLVKMVRRGELRREPKPDALSRGPQPWVYFLPE